MPMVSGPASYSCHRRCTRCGSTISRISISPGKNAKPVVCGNVYVASTQPLLATTVRRVRVPLVELVLDVES